MIRQYQDQERLFLVTDTPTLSREVYAAFLPGGERQALIDKVIELFGTNAGAGG